MRDVVVDASFVGLLHLPDELPVAKASALTSELVTRPLHVPSHWQFEIVSMLVKAEKRGRITRQQRGRMLGDIGWLLIQVDVQTPDHAWLDILPLADAHGLTVYDAAYLELAERLGAALASNDQQLLAAARSLGIDVLVAGQ